MNTIIITIISIYCGIVYGAAFVAYLISGDKLRTRDIFLVIVLPITVIVGGIYYGFKSLIKNW